MTLPPEQSEALLQLAARCEAASGPDRELDVLIHFRNMFPREMRDCKPLRDGYISTGWDALQSDNVQAFVRGATVPAYTASLDAAMTLVPEGWRFMAGQREFPRARAYVENGKPAFVGMGNRRNPDRLWAETTAATPALALALCAAALRARSLALQPGGEK